MIADRWRRADVVVRDLPLALLLVVTSFLPPFEGHETQVGDLPARPFDTVAAVVLVLETLPLALRRRAPAWCLGLVSLGFLVGELGSYHLVAATGPAFALMSAGAHLEHHRRVAAVALSAAYGALAVALHLLGAPSRWAGSWCSTCSPWPHGAPGPGCAPPGRPRPSAAAAWPRPPAPPNAPASPGSCTTW